MSDESKVKMSAEGQITLPKWVRDRLGLNGGESFLVEEDGKDMIHGTVREMSGVKRPQTKSAGKNRGSSAITGRV